MTDRKEIRHTIGDAIKTDVPDVTVSYEHEIFDVEKNLPVVLVYFDAIDVEEDLHGSRSYRGDLVVTVMNKGSDDDMEPILDAVIAATDNAIRAPNPLGTSWMLNRIEYDRNLSPAMMQAACAFSVWYR